MNHLHPQHFYFLIVTYTYLDILTYIFSYQVLRNRVIWVLYKLLTDKVTLNGQCLIKFLCVCCDSRFKILNPKNLCLLWGLLFVCFSNFCMLLFKDFLSLRVLSSYLVNPYEFKRNYVEKCQRSTKVNTQSRM